MERDNRRLKRLGVAALVLAAALGAIAAMQSGPDKIMAHEFDVVDNSGRARVTMGMLSGGPNIVLFDAQGERRAAIFVDSPGKPAILLYDAKGNGMVLGNTEPVTPRTGTTEQRSAASIVMFGNDQKHSVIWKAP